MKVGLSSGNPKSLGATVTEGGVNFAVFSQNASQIFVCLFDNNGTETRVPLPECTGGIWHGHVSGITAGQTYGFRAEGRYEPEQGHRFNVNKLLLDPYAREIIGNLSWNDALYGYDAGGSKDDLSFSKADSAPFTQRCVVTDFDPTEPDYPGHVPSDTVIYEAHVRGLTMRHPDIATGGNFDAVASEPMLDHLTKLGVTAIELLPVQAFVTDHFLASKGLTNYWGYQTVGFFAPHASYVGGHGLAGVRSAIDRIHAAGIEVILDVVYNHSGEGDELGPTLCFRGLDNQSYYKLREDSRYYVNNTGTGNTLNVQHPMVLRMVLDSLRYWRQIMGVDGFRFDLAAVLGRSDTGFSSEAALLQAIGQDPVLRDCKLIAEPWDIGPGGYQLGQFPYPFHEWNDKFRDSVRRFWRGDLGQTADFANSIAGSAFNFDHRRRPATSSVNFLTAHDGMTLTDVVSFARRHNEANGEGGKDGHSEDFSDNQGIEGSTDDPEIQSRRAARKRAMLATLLLAQGTPMILSGDELGHSQMGNNNAYNQDNETTWIDWSSADDELIKFTAKLIEFRKTHALFRQKLFLHARKRDVDGALDLLWWRQDGMQMQTSDWNDKERKFVAVELRAAAGTPAYLEPGYAAMVVFNAGEDTQFQLPALAGDQAWCHELDTSNPDLKSGIVRAQKVSIPCQSVCAFIQSKSNDPITEDVRK